MVRDSAPAPIAISVRGPDGSSDHRIVLSDDSVTLADVCDALGLRSQGVVIEGRIANRPDLERAAEVLGQGSLISTCRAEPTPRDPTPAPGSLVEVAVVAGLDAGAVTQLAPGRYRIDSPSGSTAGWYLAVDGPEREATRARPWHEHGPTVEAVQVDGAVLAFGKPVDSEAGYAGFVHRPPRALPPHAVEPIVVRPAPEPVPEPSPLSWATVLAPIPIAVFMAFFFRPLFAMFAAMGPVVALGRWFESRRRYRKATKRRDATIEQLRAEIRSELQSQGEDEAQLRWLSHPHVAELWRRARQHSVRLWERRPSSPGYLCVAIGVAPDETPVVTDGTKLDDEVHGALGAALRLRPVPHVVDLTCNTGIGLHGDRLEVMAVARALVLQLATLHGPADLRMALVCDADATASWDWLKWLPHLDRRLVANRVAPLVSQLGSLHPHRPSPTFSAQKRLGSVLVVVVDDLAADVSAIRRAAALAEIEVRVVALAPRPTMLPAACSSLVGVMGGRAEIATPQVTGKRHCVGPIGISAATASAWARSLAGSADPEVSEFPADPDHPISLLRLVNFTDAAELGRRWHARAPDAAPAAAVGIGDDGPVTIDLISDGPHGLVAGTTGSGKSEFLRTLVVALATECPPEQLNFVLVDFKGGGAFDMCARLPHIAGLITDLDEAMVGRAINSLRAELHRREQLFRDVGVSSYEEAVRLVSEPLARLLIVIDEFAALATDYGELMSSIIDLAARGRSLGMHLILATQRPSGVVDQKIRANTNLRVALRVQDPFDSQDVIGVPDAAAIDRKSPGRAIFSVGGDTPVVVQTAFSGAADLRRLRCAVQPHRLFDNAGGTKTPAGAPRGAGDPVADLPPTEIEVLIEAIEQISARRSYVPRPLWPEPLPLSLDWIDLGARVLSADLDAPRTGGAAAVPLGLADLPDKQTQLPWRWNPDSGPLVLYGASAQCAGKALVSLGAGLASQSGPDQVHLYLIDGDAANIAPLAGLPHTGAYVTLNEPDRLERTIRFFETELRRRRDASSGSELPRLVLIVDNVAAWLSTHDDLGVSAMIDRLSAVARDGAPQRVHLVISARTARDVSHRLAQHIPNRLVMSLADPSGYLTLGVKSRELVALPGMRAIDLVAKRVVQLVEPPDLDARVGDLSAFGPSAGVALPAAIGSFPMRLHAERIATAHNEAGVLTIPVGVNAIDLEAALLVLHPGDHALVFGPPGSGRSTVLLMILDQLDRSSIEVDVLRVAPAGSPLRDRALPGRSIDEVGGIEALATIDGHETIVLVDDADRIDDSMAAALELLSARQDGRIRVIAAATTDFARGVRSWTNTVRGTGTGIVLGAGPADAEVLRTKLTKLVGLGTVPGRGHLVVRGRTLPSQFALPTPTPSPTPTAHAATGDG